MEQTKTFKIDIPEGYEIDKFKPIAKNEHPKMWKYFVGAVQLRVKIVIFKVTGFTTVNKINNKNNQ